MQEVRESRDDSKTQELSESTDIFGHICGTSKMGSHKNNNLHTGVQQLSVYLVFPTKTSVCSFQGYFLQVSPFVCVSPA